METRYTIEGMDCADCASKIEAAASRVNGITGASASLGAKRLVVCKPPRDYAVAELLGPSLPDEPLRLEVSVHVNRG